ncbi:MAG: Sapep family Mn(2+)-dependent dipeptidase [Breznakia sp.]
MEFNKMIETYQNLYLSDLKELIAIESTEDLAGATTHAPFGLRVREALDCMLSIAKRDGFKVIDYDGYAGAIIYGDGEESVGVLGHLDIVPLGEDWTKKPLGLDMEDGYVFGRGVLDDKGPTLAAYYALKSIKEEGLKLSKKIILIVGCNEETGMACMDYYAKYGEIPSCGFTPDADFPVIYGEKGHLNFDIVSKDKTLIQELYAGSRPNIVIGKAEAVLPKLNDKQKEQFDFYLETNALQGKITAQGETDLLHIDGVYYHAAACYNGVNAALHILNFVGVAFQDALASTLYKLLRDWKGSAFNIAIDGGYMGFLTMNTGVVSIDDEETRITMDIRYPNDRLGSAYVEDIKEVMRKQEIDLRMEKLEISEPLFVDPNASLVTTLMQGYRKFSGDTFSPAKTIGGGTYARKFKNFVAFGPEFTNVEKPKHMFVGGPHEKDEGVRLNDLMKAMAIYADAIKNLAR